MSFTAHRAARGLLLASASIALLGLSAPPRLAPGVTYRIRMTTRLPDFGGGMGQAMGGGPVALAKATFIGAKGRIDFTALEGLGNQTSSAAMDQYLLVSDSGTMVTVDPTNATYTDGGGIAEALTLGLDGRGAMGAMGRGGGRGGRGGDGGGGGGGGGGRGGRGGDQGDQPNRGIQIHSVNVELDRLGPSDTIDNRPTDHYRINISYIMQAGPAANPVGMESTLDIWTAKLGFKLFNPFDSFGSERRPTSGPLVELMAKLASVRRQVQGEPIRIAFSVPLGNMVTGLMGGAGGSLGGGAPIQGLDLVQTTTITGITQADVNPRLLVIPTGYTKK